MDDHQCDNITKFAKTKPKKKKKNFANFWKKTLQIFGKKI
jgi:hypothetical protein